MVYYYFLLNPYKKDVTRQELLSFYSSSNFDLNIIKNVEIPEKITFTKAFHIKYYNAKNEVTVNPYRIHFLENQNITCFNEYLTNPSLIYNGFNNFENTI